MAACSACHKKKTAAVEATQQSNKQARKNKNNKRRARSALPADRKCTKGPGLTNAPRPRFRATFSWTCPCNLHRRKHPRRPTLPKGLAPCPTSNAGRAAAQRSCSASAPPPYLCGSQASESSSMACTAYTETPCCVLSVVACGRSHHSNHVVIGNCARVSACMRNGT